MPKIDSQMADVRVPTKATLAKYGLTRRDWLLICERQSWECPICREPFGERALAVDHAHVAGFRARKVKKGRKVRVMGPAERKAHVRGVLHAWCNRFVRAWLTFDRAEAILEYLKAYERRRKA